MFITMDRPNVAIGGVSELHDFTVEVNAVMFRAAIDGLYADKIKAPIREYCTNAYDGHIRAGKADMPFDVQVPSTLDPTFRVRDYGWSLSHEQVLNLITRLYASDKRGIGSEIGGLGLGCKAGFAYSSSFTVTVWKDGAKRVYLCFIGAKGFPQCTVQPAEASGRDPESSMTGSGSRTPRSCSQARAGSSTAISMGLWPGRAACSTRSRRPR